VEKVWDEEVVLPSPASTVTLTPVEDLVGGRDLGYGRVREGEKKAPPLPPRRRGLWGIASALGERAASWGEGASKEKREGNKPVGRNGGVVFDKSGSGMNPETETETVTSTPTPTPTPPPLPKRSVNRSQSRRGENNDSPSPVAQVRSLTPPDKTATDHNQNTSLTQAVNMPLPESRVGTPDGKVTPTVSRTCSPAIPPPVPRRAAARNKGTKEDEEKKEIEEGETKLASAEIKTVVVVPAEEEKLEVVEQMEDKKTDDLAIPESELTGESKAEEKESSREEEGPLTEPDAQSEEDKVDDDQMQYVGTLIWEEKMWRELVRIRKEMFYARLGAC